MRARLTALVVAALAAAALAGCGSSGDSKVAKDLQKTGTQLRQQGAALQSKAAKIEQELRDGAISQTEAEKELRAGAHSIETNATKAAGQAIDAAKQSGNVPDSVKQQLDAAQQQLKSATK